MARISGVTAISKLSGRPRSRVSLGQGDDVGVGDVAAIFAQMRGDAVGAGLDGEVGGAGGTGIGLAPGVTDGGDMVDVHAEAQAAHLPNLRLPGSSAGMAASSAGSASAG